ncbi:MAG TPA: cellulase family glycosylhydrolase, partial [Armatimonadota bacterium]|nr:cellulase family glycosylhydrolase [Armatimonadota bacterium]
MLSCKYGYAFIGFILLALATAIGYADGQVKSALFPFVLPYDDATPGVTNVSALQHTPAGKYGFITSRNGHLYAGKERIRFFGVNIAMSSCFPTHQDAEVVAARLAKFGINCVRFHHMDIRVAPGGIFAQDKYNLDPQQVDKLDYFIAQLKKHGIYSDLNLHVSRTYPDMPEWKNMPGFGKGVDNFYAPMLKLQHDYARDLLTHLNPYTKTRYVDEPAVAIIEINNENGLYREWAQGHLEDMPDPYLHDFRQLWNAWLAKHYASTEAIRTAWGEREPIGAEMLKDGNYSDGFSAPWRLELNSGAEATATVANDGPQGEKAVTFHVTKSGGAVWH